MYILYIVCMYVCVCVSIVSFMYVCFVFALVRKNGIVQALEVKPSMNQSIYACCVGIDSTYGRLQKS